MIHDVKGLVYKTYSTGRQVVDWVKNIQFTVDGYTINILKNEMVEKTAKKSGKTRKERRLTVTIDGTNSLEVGTESIKKGSFIKRLLKITNETTEEVETESFKEADFSGIEMLTDEELKSKEDRFYKLYASRPYYLVGGKVEEEYENHILNLQIESVDESDFDLDELEQMLAM